MKKQVCMFVWNYFTNDARVLRECTALSDSGYAVDLICIEDPNNKELSRHEEKNPNFNVYRVKRYPSLLLYLQKMYRLVFKYKLLAITMLLIWFLLLYMSPLPVITLSIIFLLLLKTKCRVIWIRGSIILRMVGRGLIKNYDIYHSNDLNTLPQGFICSKLRFKHRKLIYDSHEVQTSRTGYNSKIHGYLESCLIKTVDSMIVENHTRASYNKKLYGFYPNVVHNYPFKINEDVDKRAPIRKLLNLPEDEKILLYQGGIQTGRGLENLIKAAPLFKEGTLVFIGDGKIKGNLLQMVDQMNLHQKVRFIPKVPLVDLPEYTRNAFIGFQVLNNVCFNHYSASSNKLFEYIMSGVPVISCSFPEIKRVVEGERVGLCIDSHDPLSIAEGVNYLLDSPQLHGAMKKNCIKAREIYNWDYEKNQFLSIYEMIGKFD
ncbi:glycosyltransferase [Priestia megaterium]|uniref:glycosyltransferase n=1 Tax=Priestia megaterium TaxID=1404 RepID=UPI0025B10B26|nr:glycosyltransferase [Priestia megaterium]MDN3233470.1 glycosyltransferase [Priestia megaterium]